MVRFFITLVLIFSLTACGSSPKTNFYTLNTKKVPEENTEQNKNQLYLGIWLVRLPAFLDRPEMVTRVGSYGIEVADFHRWAGGLGTNITQLISSELGRQLKTDRVVLSPWLPYQKPDYQIRIHIKRLDGELGSNMYLNGTWSLLNDKGNKEILGQSFNYTTRTKNKTYNDMVAAFSKLTIELSGQIAQAITNVKKPTK
ncbi:MAG: membrane integrity-associated transporter subunit PqiC [Gammaproteobacteria bacterium]